MDYVLMTKEEYQALTWEEKLQVRYDSWGLPIKPVEGFFDVAGMTYDEVKRMNQE